MIDPALWIAFVAASLAIGLVPGPGVAAITGYAIGSGSRTAFAAVAGLAIGNFTATAISLAGMGGVLAASPVAFAVLKWAGAAVLIAIGVRQIASARERAAAAPRITAPVSPRTALAASVGIGTFHPKTIVFMAAFAPQFVDPARAYPPQAAVLAATFAATCAVTDRKSVV